MKSLGRKKSRFLTEFWHFPPEGLCYFHFLLIPLKKRDGSLLFTYQDEILYLSQSFFDFPLFYDFFCISSLHFLMLLISSCLCISFPIYICILCFSSTKSHNWESWKCSAFSEHWNMSYLVPFPFLLVTNIMIQSFCYFTYLDKLKSHYIHQHKTL